MYPQLVQPIVYVVVFASLAAILGGCASNATPPRELPQCHLPETLVCYGKQATRLERRERIEDVDFCTCERVTN